MKTYFPSNLKLLIMRTSLTRASLAKALNVSQQTVAKYLSGDAFPTIERLILMSEIFDTSIDRMLKIDLMVEDFHPPVTPEYEKVDNVDRLIKSLDNLTKEVRSLKSLK